MDITDYDLLEQHDFIEVERKELQMRFIEQTNFVFATAKDSKLARELVERLRIEYFVDYLQRKKEDAAVRTAELLDMQRKTYQITRTASGGILEIRDD